MNPLLIFGAALGVGCIGLLMTFLRRSQAQRMLQHSCSEEKKCPMCFENLRHFDEVQFPCTHSFCHFCAETLRKEQATCPVCRINVF